MKAPVQVLIPDIKFLLLVVFLLLPACAVTSGFKKPVQNGSPALNPVLLSPLAHKEPANRTTQHYKSKVIENVSAGEILCLHFHYHKLTKKEDLIPQTLNRHCDADKSFSSAFSPNDSTLYFCCVKKNGS